jgi:hypothetical protein
VAAHEFGHALMGVFLVPTMLGSTRLFTPRGAIPCLTDLELQFMEDLFRSGASARTSSAHLRNSGLIH